MTREDVVDLCRRWQVAQGGHDANALAGLYAQTARIESPMAGSVTGREGLIKTFEGFLAAFPDAVLTFEPPVIDGHRAAIVGDVSGTQVGAFMGLPPTGRTIHFRLVYLLDVQDDHIVHDRRIYDFTGLLVQIGVLKAKPV
jgi:predicted ester cyclase